MIESVALGSTTWGKKRHASLELLLERASQAPKSGVHYPRDNCRQRLERRCTRWRALWHTLYMHTYNICMYIYILYIYTYIYIYMHTVRAHVECATVA